MEIGKATVLNIELVAFCVSGGRKPKELKEEGTN
jgi:hypothetical protein